MKAWRIYFGVVAAYNLLAGLALIFGAQQAAAGFGVSGPATGYAMGLIGILVAVFGVGYAIVAWNPLPNRNLVTLGALGKASAAVLGAYYFSLGAIAQSTFMAGVVDLVMALLFALYLHQTRKMAAA